MKKSVFQNAFTLVELLVVITIIGILMGLILPAVNSARESAREVVCINNLTQLSRAMTAHVAAQNFFPSGGWGWFWIGEPDCGYGSQQPGSWFFSLLDFIEQSNVRNHGLGLNGSTRADAMKERMKTPIPMVNCPTRRPKCVYPTKEADRDKYVTQEVDHSFVNLKGQESAETRTITNVDECIKGDYAANSGTFGYDVFGWMVGGSNTQRPKMVNANSFMYSSDGKTNRHPMREYSMKYVVNPYWGNSDNPEKGLENDQLGMNGISFLFSEVTPDEVEDGLANTYMIGEKYIDPYKYTVDNGTSDADNESVYDGADNDNQRIGYIAYYPIRDTKGLDTDAEEHRFGAAHSTAFNMAFCDGSVRKVNYDIEPAIHQHLSNRRDGIKIRDWSSVNEGN